MDKKRIVARIDELMLEKGISRYELRENADISSTIYQWRKNAKRDAMRSPSLRSIEKICEYLGVSLAYFFSFDHEEQSKYENNELYKEICSLSKEQKRIIELLIKQFQQ